MRFAWVAPGVDCRDDRAAAPCLSRGLSTYRRSRQSTPSGSRSFAFWSASEDQIGVPFDDLATIAANPTYFSSSNRLVPTVHLAISFTNRDPFPTVSLVLTDLASLTLALCKTLAQTVEDNVLVARSGLLDDRGLNRIREVADQLESEVTKLKANFGSEVFAKATGRAATAK